MAKGNGGLGFRDLHDFNLALLGKHVWHFLNKPESLVSRVFKARYFPQTSVIQADRVGGSIFIWSGIWQAKEAIKKGFRWVLGDGKEIEAFSDAWLKPKLDFRVEDCHSNSTRRDKVCDFFLPNSKQWNTQLVHNCFQDVDAQIILAMRIPQNQTRDRIAWVHTKDGLYSAKSGYNLLSNQTTPQPSIPQSAGWKKLWALQLPHKIRMFLWRICRNNVPVRNMLRGKGVSVTIMCPMCNIDVEHLLHVFFDCKYATECWNLLNVSYDMSQVEFAPSWLLHQVATLSCEEVTKIATVLWEIWYARNQKVWEDKCLSPAVAVEGSTRQITEWREVMSRKNKAQLKERGVQERRRHKWLPPEMGILKLNVDASVVPGSSSFRIGMVLRDHCGQFIKGKCSHFTGEASALEAETVGIREALSWVFPQHDQEVQVESDSLTAVNAICKETVNLLEIGNAFEACREIMRSRPGMSLHFVKKQANEAAHLMARVPCELDSFKEFSSPPLSVLETIVSDFSDF